MKVKLILPALTKAKSPFWRSIKYSLFPPLGLATLAAFLSPEQIRRYLDIAAAADGSSIEELPGCRNSTRLLTLRPQSMIIFRPAVKAVSAASSPRRSVPA